MSTKPAPIYLPNFLIIGAEKSATTWLYYQLFNHPDIYLPPTKEIHFFNKYNSNLEINRNFEKLGWEWYKRFFLKWKGESAIGEATPMYLCDPIAPDRIQKYLPGVKLLVCLRNPVDRAYSHYLMAYSKGNTADSFKDLVEQKDPRFIQRGLYYKQLEKYYELFNPEQILVIIQEQMFSNIEMYFSKIYNFLNVDHFFDNIDHKKKINSAATLKSQNINNLIGKTAKWMRQRKESAFVLDMIKYVGLADKIKNANRVEIIKPTLDNELKFSLYHYYQNDISKLENLLNMKIREWHFDI